MQKLSIILIVSIFIAGCSQPETAKNTPTNAASNANANSTSNAAATAVKTTNNAPAKEAPHWDYEADGPAKWATLSKDWATCGSGKAQSPIDIKPAAASTLPEIKMNFKPAELKIIHSEHLADAINNGHTIQVNYGSGDTLTIGDATYDLKQYHFHAPSEHTVNGKHYPMEMHMVHASADNKLAVVGVFIEEGAENAAFAPVWAKLPTSKSVESHYADVKVDINQLLPGAKTSYRYDGSLTTPPCSESVKWIVMTEPIKLSTAQVSKFTAIINKNNRPTQGLNGRAIASDKVAEKPAS